MIRRVLDARGQPPVSREVGRLLAVPLALADQGTPGEADRPDRFRLFEAMVQALTGVDSAGVLAVIDDLHRADDASLAFLRYLAAEVHQLPVVVLGAYRDTEAGPGHPLMSALGAMADGGPLEVLALPGLADAEVRTLVARHAGAVPDKVADQVVARAEGNPFFVVEIARLLRSAPGDLPEVASELIPPTVREVITYRLARLPPESRRALQAAAVLGREFGQLPLSQTLGAPSVAVAGALQPAATTGLISAEGRSGYSFTHALVQAVSSRLPYFTTLRALAALAAATTGRHDAATWEIDRLSGHGFAAVPRDSLWVATTALFLEAFTGGRLVRRPSTSTTPRCWPRSASAADPGPATTYSPTATSQRGGTMPIVVVFDFPGEDIAKYHKVFELGGPAVNAQPSRFDHLCYQTDTGFTVIDVWEDEASFNAFGPVIGPALTGAGLDPKPTIHPLAGSMGRDGKHVVY